ncbi:MAG: CoA transferase [Alphaproteobacteria bacterium]|nr:CoA transferase [Alphaproteobacteria bacterium]
MKPLAGIRVLDFGLLTAGANTSAMLGDLGAEVVKIESGAYMDPFRAVGQRDTSPGWWNRSPPFHFTNRNKRGVALNLKHAEGRRLILELAKGCDVVVENFRRGVLERFGLDYAALKAANPRIVLASISSQGDTGPNRLHASYGSTLDATGGMAALTGYADDGLPRISGMDVNYPDQVVSLLAAGLVIAAVMNARRTGRGALLDISQREIASFMIGEEIVAAAADPARRTPSRQGNAQDGVALQRCLRCADGRWLAITLQDEKDEVAWATVIDDVSIDQWAASQDAEAAARVLNDAGIAAAVVKNGMDLIRDRALAGDTLAWLPDGGLVKGMPYRFAGMPLVIERRAPDLGEHTGETLRELLGLDDQALARLAELGVTSAEPERI